MCVCAGAFDSVMLCSQCNRAGPDVSWRARRQFRFERAAYLSTAAHPETGSIHAQPAQTAGGHAAHNGQRCRILFLVNIIYIHIQVSVSPTLSAFFYS